MGLLDDLIGLRGRIRAPFHVPGHHFGRIIDKRFKDSVFDIDFTEVYGSDNLHSPEGIIRDAQLRASSYYGSDEAFLLVNGTTSGNMAAIMASVSPGGKALIAADAHKSCYSGALMADIGVVCAEVGVTPDGMMSTCIAPEVLEREMIKNPDAGCVVITYPNYFGYACDIDRIVDVVHRNDRILIVDQAHGAHFAMSDVFPKCAVGAGADIVVQSTHKTLPCMTQGSVLHVSGERVDRDRLRLFLSMLQTSSPSYVLMASIDNAVDIARSEGGYLSNVLNDEIRRFWAGIADAGGMSFDANFSVEAEGRDFSRIVLSPNRMACSGYELDRIFRDRYGIYSEMATHNALVLAATIANVRSDFDAVIDAVSRETKSNGERNPFSARRLGMISQSREYGIRPSQAMARERARLRYDLCEGRVSADFVTPYPPGIPILIPGEIVMHDAIENIRQCLSAGHDIMGVLSESCEICVIK